MKKCSKPLIIKEAQIKTITRGHFTHIRIAIIKKKKGKKSQQGFGNAGRFRRACDGCQNGIVSLESICTGP